MRMHPAIPLLSAALLTVAACNEPQVSVQEPAPTPPAAPRFTVMDPATTGIDHVNVLEENEAWNILRYEYLYNGAGVAIGDINNDGLADIYLVSNSGADRLYLNEGGFRFRDISEAAGIAEARGYKSGVTMVDVNGDGLLDIHVCRTALGQEALRRNLLYINNGDLTFSEQAAAYGLDDPSFSTQAYFFDMDLDGDLDLYLVNHPHDMREANNIRVIRNAQGELVPYQQEDLTYITDRLYRNDKGRFTDITDQAGVRNEAFGLSAAIGHFNDDLLPDIYVCNDYVKPDQLWINNGDGTFTDRFAEQFMCSAFSTMGSDLADINNDGYPDLFTVDMTARDRYRYQTLGMATNFDKYRKILDLGLQAQFATNMLQLNNGNGTFSNIGFLSNMAYTDWSWSALLADLDNDGWKDAVVSNGYVRDVTNNDYQRYMMDSLQKELRAGNITLVDWLTSIPSVKVRSFLFRNEGDLTFSDRSAEWNAGPPAFSNGAAYADLDNDGHLDLVMNNINDVAFVMRNNGASLEGHGHVRFQLDAGPGRSAWGSRVELELPDGSRQLQCIQPARGFLSCSETIAHFGIGHHAAIARAIITWPDGGQQVLEAPEPRVVHKVLRQQGLAKAPPPPKAESLFTDLGGQLPPGMQHRENDYIDLKREPLLHHLLSTEGPAVAVGDVNGDGLDDVYIGGAYDHAGKLFLQRPDGTFGEAAQPAFAADRGAEDVAALLFDADGDGDLDLYVGSGGNERPRGDASYADRLYLNDGHGLFTRAADALPQLFSSTGCVRALDVDGDGDLDLFVGSRSSPGRYPMQPTSYLLRNEGGRFTDATAQWSEGLQYMGMVTDARFADLDGDGREELVVVGEWMPITVFRWADGRFTDATDAFGLGGTTGWWCAVDVADLDGDGLPEIIAGNAGLNGALRTSPQEPVTIHYKDFDGNGTIDPILCAYWEGRSYPVHMRDRLQDQMVMLKKRFLRYHGFALAAMEDIFTPAERKDMGTLQANTFAHTLFRNQAGRSFAAEALPNMAQTSMARAITCLDADRDGRSDVIVAGNHHGTDAQFGRFDACIGLFMKGDGRGGLEAMPARESGLLLRGHVRRLLPITVGGRECLLVVRNNEAFGLVGLPPATMP
jgi:hypothetical protein